MDKYCKFCGTTKPEEEFAWKRGKRQGKCKACHNKYQKEYWMKSEGYEKHKVRMREYKKRNDVTLKCKKYGMTEDEYHTFMEASQGKCQICKVEPFEAIDHDHVTGKVRGFLCRGCNHGLGNFKDSIDNLQAAMLYLNR